MNRDKLIKLGLLCGVSMTLFGCNTTSNTDSSSDSLIDSSSEEVVKPTEDDKIHLVLLTGQSGARGKALVSDLDDEEKALNYDVDIIADGLTMPSLSNIPETFSSNVKLTEVGPGFGDSASEFGPELGIAQTLASRYPKDGNSRKSVIVKYTACGSTFIADWFSKSLVDSEFGDLLNYKQARTDGDGNVWGPLTNNFLQLVDYTISTLEDEGYEVVIDGCAFIHGEQDSKFDDNMTIFEEALRCYVNDVREYFDDEDMPFVITEALTNSGKYCNQLKEIQRKVAAEFDNCSFVTNEGLLSNTFEPWHFGKESNYVIGNRIAAELVAYNDTRVVSSFEDMEIKVPLNADVTLPKYAVATYENDYVGYSKIKYTSTYDKTKLGKQEVTFEASGIQSVKGKLVVDVTNEVFVDGIMNEYSNAKAITLGDLGKIYVTKGTEGLYFSASINDKQVWTDGEEWKQNDMGQNGKNDDFRIYLTTSEASSRTTLCLSSANLLRIYVDGVSLSESSLANKNQVYKKYVDGYYYRVNTKGIVNDSTVESGGVDFELFIPYYALGMDETDDIKVCFNYNNVDLDGNVKKATNNYYGSMGYSTENNLEELTSSYISISELI